MDGRNFSCISHRKNAVLFTAILPKRAAILIACDQLTLLGMIGVFYLYPGLSWVKGQVNMIILHVIKKNNILQR